jgi:ATP-dependent helicase/DNAse subunit B
MNDFSADAALTKLGAPRRVYALEQPINVRIPIGHGVETIFVRGKIDRIDAVGDGLIVIDYKTGTTKIPVTEMETGRNFQMTVYLLALETLLKRDKLDWHVRGGAFWHIRNLTLSGEMTLYHDSAFTQVVAHESIQQAQEHIAHYILQARHGAFPVQPTNPDDRRCSSYCDFYQLCRVSITNRYKQA